MAELSARSAGVKLGAPPELTGGFKLRRSASNITLRNSPNRHCDLASLGMSACPASSNDLPAGRPSAGREQPHKIVSFTECKDSTLDVLPIPTLRRSVAQNIGSLCARSKRVIDLTESGSSTIVKKLKLNAIREETQVYLPCTVCGWCEVEIDECSCLQEEKGNLDLQKAWVSALVHTKKWFPLSVILPQESRTIRGQGVRGHE